MKKRILSMLLAIVMVVGLLPGMGLTAFAADDDTPTATAIYVKETTTSGTEDGSKENPYTTLQAAFEATTNGGNYEIILLSDITVSDAVDQWSSTYKRYEHLRYSAAANVTLKSDNDAGKIYTIYRDCDGLMIWLYGKNASDLLTLTLQDIVIDGRAGDYTSENDVYALIGITNTDLYIKEGTTLKNNVNTASTAIVTTGQGCGGAINMSANTSLTMTGGSIQYCKAIYGGGVYAPTGSISIEGGTFEYNEATGDSSGTYEANAKGGGAIYKAGGTLKISGGTFQYNKAYRGGAIFGTGSITISGGEIKNNTAIKHGGGIFSTNAMTISAGTISENCASGRGGGIFRISSQKQLQLLGGTVSGNTEGTNKVSSGVVDYRTVSQSDDTISNTSDGGYISSYVFTMVYMNNSFNCVDTIYTNRPLRITEWDSTSDNSYKIEPLVTSSALTVPSSYGGALPRGNFVVFGGTEDVQPDLSKFSSTGYTLIKKDTLDRFIFYGVPLTAPQITLAAENGVLQYTITPVDTETDAISGYEIQLYQENGTTKVGEPVSVTARTGTLTADAGTYKASVRAIDKKKNESGYIVKDITRYCESAWSSLSAAAVVKDTYTITYDLNNGSGNVPAAQTQDVGAGFSSAAQGDIARTGYTFLGWAKEASAATAEYAAGATVSDINTNTTLYAVWKVNSYTITFEENGGSAVADITANYNSAVTKPADPVKSGYTFGGWYSDSTLTQAYTFTTMPVGGITLYAKWTEDPTSDPDPDPTPDPDPDPDPDPTPDPEPDPEPAPDPTPTPDPEDAVCRKDSSCPIYPYKDADPKEWYHDGVHYCLEEGIMIGYPDGTFQPYTETTRAQVVMMLWRLQGSPKVSYNLSYTDVDGNGWYTEAIRWGTYAGVVEGNGDGTFTPDDSITREQMAAMFCRYAKVMGKDVSASASLSFSDADQVSDWAVDEVKWAVGSGLMEGIGNNTLAPTASANRAQVATVMYRFCEGS